MSEPQTETEVRDADWYGEDLSGREHTGVRFSGVDLTELKVDGGMIANNTLMQFQADIIGVPVVRPVVAETTALGAAYAAGLTTGFWKDTDELRANWNEDQRWEPTWDAEQRETGYAGWKKAVERTLDWVDVQ